MDESVGIPESVTDLASLVTDLVTDYHWLHIHPYMVALGNSCCWTIFTFLVQFVFLIGKNFLKRYPSLGGFGYGLGGYGGYGGFGYPGFGFGY